MINLPLGLYIHPIAITAFALGSWVAVMLKSSVQTQLFLLHMLTYTKFPPFNGAARKLRDAFCVGFAGFVLKFSSRKFWETNSETFYSTYPMFFFRYRIAETPYMAFRNIIVPLTFRVVFFQSVRVHFCPCIIGKVMDLSELDCRCGWDDDKC